MSEKLRVAILGGGISGLATAYALLKCCPQVETVLFEATPRFGGVIRTERSNGFLIEHGPDMFSTEEPSVIELCRQLGIECQLVTTNEKFRRAFVVRNGRLYPVPAGFALLQPRRLWPILTSRLLSTRGKLRLLTEYFVPPRTATADESLADFTLRRFGREALERLIQPLVSGIYTADPYRLSMAACFQRFVRLEREYGSLIRAAWHLRGANRGSAAQSSGARYGLFVAPQQGMQFLVDTLVAQLPPRVLRCGCRIECLTRTAESWNLGWQEDGQGRCRETFDAVVVALPNDVAADLTQHFDASLAAELAGIRRASTAIVVLGIGTTELPRSLDGFGYVCPLAENRPILAGSFSSLKFPGRAPDGHAILRFFIGGACRSDDFHKPDEQLVDWALRDLRELFGYRGTPQLQKVIRWPASMPQYDVGHLERIRRIDAHTARWPGLFWAGNAYHGVGIPQCIRSGQQAAANVQAYLERRATSNSS